MSTQHSLQKPSVCVCMNIRRASRAITKIYDQALESSGLKVTQFSILMNIDAFGPLNVSALAKLLTLDRTTIVRNLKPLDSAGFILNTPSHDPRERQISLTEQGQQTIKHALPFWKKVQKQIKQKVEPKNLDALNCIATLLEGLASEHGEEVE